MIQALPNILALCVALAAAETLHGIFRAVVLVPRVGKRTALKIAIVTGSTVAFIVCYYFVPRMGISEPVRLLGVGLVAATFMSLFDILFARLVMKRPLAKSLDDFNPKTGNYLIFGLLLLIVSPLIVMVLRRG